MQKIALRKQELTNFINIEKNVNNTNIFQIFKR